MAIIQSNEPDDLISEINVTPLVDVMLVLLMVFMIALAVVKFNIFVDLPGEANPVKNFNTLNINISEDASGSIFIDDKRLTNNTALLNQLIRLVKEHDGIKVHISADENLKYKNIAALIATCKKAGIKKISFLTQNPKN